MGYVAVLIAEMVDGAAEEERVLGQHAHRLQRRPYSECGVHLAEQFILRVDVRHGRKLPLPLMHLTADTDAQFALGREGGDEFRRGSVNIGSETRSNRRRTRGGFMLELT